MKSNTVTKLKTTTGFQIESGISAPMRKKSNPYATTFAKMKVGDSFLIGSDYTDITNVKYYAKSWGRDTDRTFAFRTTDAGVRCWRVK